MATGTLLATLAACGNSSSEPEADPPASASESASEGAGEATACDGDTQEVEGARGVMLTVPADWTVEVLGGGEDVRLAGPDGDTVEGQLVVQETGQTIDEGVSDAERLNSQSEKTAEEEIELPGFDAARQLAFEGAATGSSNTTVVAVSGGLRVVAYAIVEDSPDDLALATGCMLTLRR